MEGYKILKLNRQENSMKAVLVDTDSTKTVTPTAIWARNKQSVNNSNQTDIKDDKQPAANKECLVTIAGELYDVSPLRNSHPGGEGFVCGGEMTAVYKEQHGEDMSRHKPYLVAGVPTKVGGIFTEKQAKVLKEPGINRRSWKKKARMINT